MCSTSESRPSGVAERTHVHLDGVRAAVRRHVAAHEIGAQNREQPRRREVPCQRKHRARDFHLASGPEIEAHRIHQHEPRDARRPSHRHRLRDPAADVVADNARIVDRERVEQAHHSLGVAAHGNIAAGRPIASPVAEQIDDNNAVSLRNERDDLGPEVRRRWKSVKKDDRLAGSATSGSVVVEPRTVYVNELTSHGVRRSEEERGSGRTSGMAVKIKFTWQDVPGNASSQANRRGRAFPAAGSCTRKHPLASGLECAIVTRPSPVFAESVIKALLHNDLMASPDRD